MDADPKQNSPQPPRRPAQPQPNIGDATSHQPPPAIAGSHLEGFRVLRRQTEGVLAFEERRAEVRFIHDGSSAHIIIPVEPGFARIRELALFAPDESAWTWQAMLTPSIIERPESEECVDRWAAYHAKAPPGSVWIRARLEALKSPSQVWDAPDAAAPNPLRPVEPRLIKSLNADRDTLARACKVHACVDIADPLVVGIDPYGVDVRARFGIVRIEFPDNIHAQTEHTALLAIDFLLAKRPWSAQAP